MAIVSLSSKGQLTLPEALRKKLGLGKGDMLHVEEKEGKIILCPVSVVPTRFYTDEEITTWVKEDTLTEEEKKTFDAAVARLEQEGARKP